MKSKIDIKNQLQVYLSIFFRYQKGKTLLDMIFGSKIHKEFPRKYLSSKTCGDGFWESTGKGNYQNPGVDAEIAIGSNVSHHFMTNRHADISVP